VKLEVPWKIASQEPKKKVAPSSNQEEKKNKTVMEMGKKTGRAQESWARVTDQTKKRGAGTKGEGTSEEWTMKPGEGRKKRGRRKKRGEGSAILEVDRGTLLAGHESG